MNAGPGGPTDAEIEACSGEATAVLDAALVFEPNREMEVGVTETVIAAVTRNVEAAPGDVLQDAIDPIAVPVRLPCRVEASLTGIPGQFAIEPPGFVEATVSEVSEARWSWLVRPLQTGENIPLLLTVQGVLDNGIDELIAGETTKQVAINVRVRKVVSDVQSWLDSKVDEIEITLRDDQEVRVGEAIALTFDVTFPEATSPPIPQVDLDLLSLELKIMTSEEALTYSGEGLATVEIPITDDKDIK